MSEGLWDTLESWAWSTLGNVAEWASGGTPKSTEKKFYNGDIPWLVIGDLNDRVVTSSAKTITSLGLENSSAKIVKKGAILVAMYGSIGKLGLAGIKCSTNQAIAFTEKIHPDIETKYLFYYLLHARTKLNEVGKGGAQQNISQTVLKDFPICIAPLKEQRRIVAKLEKLLSRVDAAQERLATIPRILKRFRQSVLAAACSGRLTADWRESHGNLSSVMASYSEGLRHRRYQYDISPDVEELPDLPPAWQYVPIGNVSDFQQGMQIAKSTRLKEGGANRLPILRTVNYSNAFREDVEYVELNEQSLIAEADDIILARTGTIGKVLTGYRGVFHNNTFRLNYDKKLLLNKYLVYWLESYFVQSYISRNAGRSAQADLTHKAFAPCPLPLSPKQEQQEIVRRVEALFKTADALEARYRKAKEHVNKLTQSILARAFRGELVTTEAELARQEGRDYEPASVLLERIRQERAQQHQATSKRKSKQPRVARKKAAASSIKLFT